jgi:hypothetical protein
MADYSVVVLPHFLRRLASEVPKMRCTVAPLSSSRSSVGAVDACSGF